jgi:hypothetical protein
MPKGEAANSLQMLERSKFKKSSTKTTLETERISTNAGEGGILWWGSAIPSRGLQWAKAEVVGTRHWAVGMMDVTIGVKTTLVLSAGSQLPHNFPTRFECKFTSFPLVSSVNSHLFHSFRV